MGQSITILYISIVTAATQMHGTRVENKAWMAQGEFATYPDCIEASRTLKLKNEDFKCVPTGRQAFLAEKRK